MSERPSLIGKTLAYFQARGLAATIGKIAVYFLNRLRFSLTRYKANRADDNFLKTMTKGDSASIFSEIHARNLWGSQESRSGPGSEVSATNNVRAQLPGIVARFGVKRILDAPCGDFNWMRLVQLPPDISYVGGDIVRRVIIENRKNHSSSQRQFLVLDILRDSLPAADILICRDCLFHLSYKDILLVLNNFIASDIRLLLTTTHRNGNEFANTDILTGGCRNIDLFKAPFSLPKEVLYRVVEDDGTRELCLWTREQILSAVRLVLAVG